MTETAVGPRNLRCHLHIDEKARRLGEAPGLRIGQPPYALIGEGHTACTRVLPTSHSFPGGHHSAKRSVPNEVASTGTKERAGFCFQ